jgi:ABC-type transporter Mla subunit MlaD
LKVSRYLTNARKEEINQALSHQNRFANVRGVTAREMVQLLNEIRDAQRELQAERRLTDDNVDAALWLRNKLQEAKGLIDELRETFDSVDEALDVVRLWCEPPVQEIGPVAARHILFAHNKVRDVLRGFDH